MKIIINTTNLKGGGALQVAVSFIYECLNFVENRYYVFLSPAMENEIDCSKFTDNFYFFSFNNPSRFLFLVQHIGNQNLNI